MNLKTLRKLKNLFLLGGIHVFLFANISLAGNGLVVDGLGAKSLGMGAVNTATVDNSYALSYNPAAMWSFNEGVLDFDIGLIYPKLHFKNSLNDEDARDSLSVLPSAGFVSKPVGDFKYGFGLHPIAGLSSEYNLRHPLYGSEIYESQGAVIKFPVGCAYKINDNFFVGTSFGLLYQNLKTAMPFTPKSGSLAGLSATSNFRVDGVGLFGNVGLLYLPNDRVRIGAVYKSKTAGDVSGDAILNMYAQLQAMGLYPDIISDPIGKYSAEFDMEWPQSFSIGFSYQVTEKLLLATDVEWINWSDMMGDVTVNYNAGSNPALNALGLRAIEYIYPADWDDQYVIRIGGEYAVTNNLTFRSGLIYGESPIPDESLIPIIGAITECSGTLGVGYKIPDKCEINLAYEHSFENKQRTGVSTIAEEYNNSSVGVSADFLYFGLTYRIGDNEQDKIDDVTKIQKQGISVSTKESSEKERYPHRRPLESYEAESNLMKKQHPMMGKRDPDTLKRHKQKGEEYSLQQLPKERPAATQILYPYSIHISSYQNPAYSKREVDKFRKNGHQAFTSPAHIPGKGMWYRVFIGFYETQEEAKREAIRLGKHFFPYTHAFNLPYAVRIGPFDTDRERKNFEAHFRLNGYVAYRMPEKRDCHKTRLLIGAFETRKEALKLSEKLFEKGFMATVVQR